MANLERDLGFGADEPKAKEPNLEGFVRIQYRIDNLKANGKNATIDRPQFNDKGFSIIVRGKDNGELAKRAFNPRIVKLPYEIIPAESYLDTSKDNFLFVYLKKAETSRSWEYEIKNNLLENAQREDGN